MNHFFGFSRFGLILAFLIGHVCGYRHLSAQDELVVSIEVDPATPIMLGKTLTLSSQIKKGGVAPHTYAFSLICKNGLATRVPNVPGGNPQEPAGQTCASVAGNFSAKVVVTSSDNKTGRAETEIEILPPDTITDTPFCGNASSTGPQVFQVVHAFRVFRADGNRAVGSCFQTAALERIWKKVNGVWEATPDPNLPEPWQRVGESPELSPSFHYSSSMIYDTKVYTAPPDFDLGTLPDNFMLDEYKQQVAIRVQVCGKTDPLVVKSQVMHFIIRKVSVPDPNNPGQVLPAVIHDLQN